jgi:hypothetical protein
MVSGVHPLDVYEYLRLIATPIPTTRDAHALLRNRIAAFGLCERNTREDGNCQFDAVADQLQYFSHPNTCSYKEVRRRVVAWLRANKDFLLSNGAALCTFLLDDENTPDVRWNNYCDSMTRDGSEGHPATWGDGLTIVAISEIFGVSIGIWSTVGDDDSYVTYFTPKTPSSRPMLLLGHIAELHYISLAPAQGILLACMLQLYVCVYVCIYISLY